MKRFVIWGPLLLLAGFLFGALAQKNSGLKLTLGMTEKRMDEIIGADECGSFWGPPNEDKSQLLVKKTWVTKSGIHRALFDVKGRATEVSFIPSKWSLWEKFWKWLWGH